MPKATASHVGITDSTGHFADRLVAAIDRCGSPVCVGIDPVMSKLPRACFDDCGAPVSGAKAIEIFCRGVIEAVAGGVGAMGDGKAGPADAAGGGGSHARHIVPAVKFQSACFERYGAPGMAALGACIKDAKYRGLMVILDAKRGDIGVSAEHYAAAAFGERNPQDEESVYPNCADCVTVNGYLGADTIEPYLRGGTSRGVFVLVRTSNPGSDAVQGLQLADGRTVAEMMADIVDRLGATRIGASGLSTVGAVVGATKSADAAALRARMPNSLILVPGYGAQGGTADDVRAMVRPAAMATGSPGQSGILVTASRSVIYAFKAESNDATAWKHEVAEAARKLAAEVRRVVMGGECGENG